MGLCKRINQLPLVMKINLTQCQHIPVINTPTPPFPNNCVPLGNSRTQVPQMHHGQYTGWFFLTGSAVKVLSAGDGKIPNKKVKVTVCHREYSNFQFFSREFAIFNTFRTFRAEPVKKNHPV